MFTLASTFTLSLADFLVIVMTQLIYLRIKLVQQNTFGHLPR